MRCKKEIMGIAALMVLLFHFYIPFGRSPVETYLFRSTFIGVDLFFFVSAYSIATFKGDSSPIKFILNRLRLVYLPFVVLSVIGAIWKKWSFLQFLKVIGGVEFYERGGGSFLWYFIGITIVYLFVPLMLMLKRKLGIWGFPILVVAWLLVSILMQFGLNYLKMFIFINRLPIFFIGLYFDELILKPVGKLNKWVALAIEIVLFAIGTVLVFKFGTTYRLNKPFADMYYIIAIPLIIATVLLLNNLFMAISKYKWYVLKFIGGITLELYGLQMIFGYDIESKLIKVMPVTQLAFVLTIVALVAMAFVLNMAFKYGRKLTNKVLKTKKA